MAAARVILLAVQATHVARSWCGTRRSTTSPTSPSPPLCSRPSIPSWALLAGRQASQASWLLSVDAHQHGRQHQHEQHEAGDADQTTATRERLDRVEDRAMAVAELKADQRREHA